MARDTVDLNPASTADVKSAGLAYVSDLDPGLSRQKASGGFTYRRPDGRSVTDEPSLDRIRKLAIPPAWTQVWICLDPRGHIQATGRDTRGRKQYRYHDRWRQVRDEGKYARLVAFGRALPRLRARLDRDLSRRGLPREKVLAAVIRVMEITLIRVGNEEYARTNRSFGLTTLRNRHAKVGTARAMFEFRGKSGKIHRAGFTNRRLARVVRACQELPGQRLFQYLDDEGRRHSVESADVNAYLRDALGDDFSAKDFRTWAGTLSAARALAMAPPADGVPTGRHVNACVKAVAALLGNTAAVCRRAYIDPAVIAAYESGSLPPDLSRAGRASELALLKFLEAARDQRR
jgi:DNA topoisomerase-1